MFARHTECMYKAPVRLDQRMDDGTGWQSDHNIHQHALCVYNNSHVRQLFLECIAASVCICVYAWILWIIWRQNENSESVQLHEPVNSSLCVERCPSQWGRRLDVQAPNSLRNITHNIQWWANNPTSDIVWVHSVCVCVCVDECTILEWCYLCMRGGQIHTNFSQTFLIGFRKKNFMSTD